MRCRQAIELIHAEQENLLDRGKQVKLRAHVAGCPACAVYQTRANELLGEMDLDARAIASSSVGDGFRARLHDALVAEGALRQPLHKPSRVAQSLPGVRWRPVRATSGVFALALLGFALLLASAALTPPPRSCADIRFDHIAAFSSTRSADGRVYAALTQREAAVRPDFREGRRR